MRKIIFDSSSHLAQFCTTNEKIRKGCKNMQAAISPAGKEDCIGSWTDLENGRTDRAVWNLPTEAQDGYYPIMDRYYSIMNVEQQPMTDDEEVLACRLKTTLPSLNAYSRHTCARAILKGASEIQTLFDDLLAAEVISYMSDNHNIQIVRPQAAEEQEYDDTLLEERYQIALATFKLLNINPPAQLDDERVVRL